MHIKICNFGPVREFEINLEKDFHLFLGKNNIGKSYSITVVYLIIKTFCEFNTNVFSLSFSKHLIFDDIASDSLTTLKIKELSKTMKLHEEVDIKSSVLSDFSRIFKDFVIQKLTNSFENTFSSIENLSNRYSGENPTISIKQADFSFDIEIKESRLDIINFKSKKEYILKRIKSKREALINKDKCTVYFSKNDEEYNHSSLNFIFINSFFEFINKFRKTIDDIHYLPASRSGLYQALSAFGQIVAELSKNRSFLSKKIEIPGISEPVSDYFIKMSEIKVQKRNYENKKINTIAREIEEKILKGRVEFNSQTKQLMFFPDKTNLKLELSSTSSMVSELAPIVSYLRYVLTETNKSRGRGRDYGGSQLIMIEEPEAHLHPEIQIVLTEIFSRLIGVNVKLIITSHSNYIFNKTNNLVLSKELPSEKVSSAVFKSSPKGSLSCELEVTELGVEDDNFMEATSLLFEEKMKIISSLNEEEDEGHCDD